MMIDERFHFLAFPSDAKVYNEGGDQVFFKYPPSSFYAYCSFVFKYMLHDHSDYYRMCIERKLQIIDLSVEFFFDLESLKQEYGITIDPNA